MVTPHSISINGCEKMSTTIHKPKLKKEEPEISTSEKSENTQSKELQDIHSISQHNITRYFNEVNATTANYLQSITDLQLQIMELRKNNVDSTIDLEQDLSKKLGISGETTDVMLNLLNSISEQTSKTLTLQNKLLLSSLDAIQKNIKTFNDNTENFYELNKKIMKLCFLGK